MLQLPEQIRRQESRARLYSVSDSGASKFLDAMPFCIFLQMNDHQFQCLEFTSVYEGVHLKASKQLLFGHVGLVCAQARPSTASMESLQQPENAVHIICKPVKSPTPFRCRKQDIVFLSLGARGSTAPSMLQYLCLGCEMIGAW